MVSRRASTIRSARHAVKALLGDSRLGLAALRAGGGVRGEWTVTPATDVCIEGYPRSGNSFAVRAFRSWNPDAKLAHHVHLPAQIAEAARLGVPCAVLIRPPVDAVSSLSVFSELALSPRVLLWSYRRLYRRVERQGDAVVVLPFESVVADPACVPRAVNARFGTRFAYQSLTATEREALLERIRGASHRRGDAQVRWAVPSAEKNELKRRITEAVLASPGLEPARELYARLVARAPAEAEPEPARDR